MRDWCVTNRTMNHAHGKAVLASCFPGVGDPSAPIGEFVHSIVREASNHPSPAAWHALRRTRSDTPVNFAHRVVNVVRWLRHARPVGKRAFVLSFQFPDSLNYDERVARLNNAKWTPPPHALEHLAQKQPRDASETSEQATSKRRKSRALEKNTAELPMTYAKYLLEKCKEKPAANGLITISPEQHRKCWSEYFEGERKPYAALVERVYRELGLIRNNGDEVNIYRVVSPVELASFLHNMYSPALRNKVFELLVSDDEDTSKAKKMRAVFDTKRDLDETHLFLSHSHSLHTVLSSLHEDIFVKKCEVKTDESSRPTASEEYAFVEIISATRVDTEGKAQEILNSNEYKKDLMEKLPFLTEHDFTIEKYTFTIQPKESRKIVVCFYDSRHVEIMLNENDQFTGANLNWSRVVDGGGCKLEIAIAPKAKLSLEQFLGRIRKEKDETDASHAGRLAQYNDWYYQLCVVFQKIEGTSWSHAVESVQEFVSKSKSLNAISLVFENVFIGGVSKTRDDAYAFTNNEILDTKAFSDKVQERENLNESLDNAFLPFYHAFVKPGKGEILCKFFADNYVMEMPGRTKEDSLVVLFSQSLLRSLLAECCDDINVPVYARLVLQSWQIIGQALEKRYTIDMVEAMKDIEKEFGDNLSNEVLEGLPVNTVKEEKTNALGVNKQSENWQKQVEERMMMTPLNFSPSAAFVITCMTYLQRKFNTKKNLLTGIYRSKIDLDKNKNPAQIDARKDRVYIAEHRVLCNAVQSLKDLKDIKPEMIAYMNKRIQFIQQVFREKFTSPEANISRTVVPTHFQNRFENNLKNGQKNAIKAAMRLFDDSNWEEKIPLMDKLYSRWTFCGSESTMQKPFGIFFPPWKNAYSTHASLEEQGKQLLSWRIIKAFNHVAGANEPYSLAIIRVLSAFDVQLPSFTNKGKAFIDNGGDHTKSGQNFFLRWVSSWMHSLITSKHAKLNNEPLKMLIDHKATLDDPRKDNKPVKKAPKNIARATQARTGPNEDIADTFSSSLNKKINNAVGIYKNNEARICNRIGKNYYPFGTNEVASGMVAGREASREIFVGAYDTRPFYLPMSILGLTPAEAVWRVLEHVRILVGEKRGENSSRDAEIVGLSKISKMLHDAKTWKVQFDLQASDRVKEFVIKACGSETFTSLKEKIAGADFIPKYNEDLFGQYNQIKDDRKADGIVWNKEKAQKLLVQRFGMPYEMNLSGGALGGELAQAFSRRVAPRELIELYGQVFTSSEENVEDSSDGSDCEDDDED